MLDLVQPFYENSIHWNWFGDCLIFIRSWTCFRIIFQVLLNSALQIIDLVWFLSVFFKKIENFQLFLQSNIFARQKRTWRVWRSLSIILNDFFFISYYKRLISTLRDTFQSVQKNKNKNNLLWTCRQNC